MNRPTWRRRGNSTLAAAGVALVAAMGVNASTARADRANAASSHIVLLADSTKRPGAVAKRHARRLGMRIGHVYRHAIKGYAARVPAGRADELRALPGVRSVERNLSVAPATDPGRHPFEMDLKDQLLPSGVDRIDADVSSVRAGDGRGALSGPAVAVLDTGVTPHPDLNLVGGHDCTNTGGYHDDWTDGFRYLDGPHGTPVAGVIGAKDNSFGVVGVAPHVPLYSVKFMSLLPRRSRPPGFIANLLCALDWLVGNAPSLGIRVANISASASTLLPYDSGTCGGTNGGTGLLALERAACALADAGVTLVAAAGQDPQNNPGEPISRVYPAGLDEVLAVTGMADVDGQPGSLAFGQVPVPCAGAETDDVAMRSSNYALGVPGSPVDGPPDTVAEPIARISQREYDAAHTAAAPARCIVSTFPDGRYTANFGTSFAAPHVAGTIALCIARGPCKDLTPRQIIARIRADALAQPVTYGFVGDPWRGGAVAPYFGPLVYAGGY